ncbi:hypothetical protein ABK040_001563 [Willaertia magna]
MFKQQNSLSEVFTQTSSWNEEQVLKELYDTLLEGDKLSLNTVEKDKFTFFFEIISLLLQFHLLLTEEQKINILKQLKNEHNVNSIFLYYLCIWKWYLKSFITENELLNDNTDLNNIQDNNFTKILNALIYFIKARILERFYLNENNINNILNHYKKCNEILELNSFQPFSLCYFANGSFCLNLIETFELNKNFKEIFNLAIEMFTKCIHLNNNENNLNALYNRGLLYAGIDIILSSTTTSTENNNDDNDIKNRKNHKELLKLKKPLKALQDFTLCIERSSNNVNNNTVLQERKIEQHNILLKALYSRALLYLYEINDAELGMEDLNRTIQLLRQEENIDNNQKDDCINIDFINNHLGFTLQQVLYQKALLVQNLAMEELFENENEELSLNYGKVALEIYNELIDYYCKEYKLIKEMEGINKSNVIADLYARKSLLNLYIFKDKDNFKMDKQQALQWDNSFHNFFEQNQNI